MAFEMKLLSSLEKVFLADNLSDKPAYRAGSMLRNEVFNFQVAYRPEEGWLDKAVLRLSSPIASFVTLRRVEVVPSQMPAYPGLSDSGYITTQPGLFPDLLLPYAQGQRLTLVPGQSRSLWLSVEGDIPPGTYPITLSFVDRSGATLAEDTFTLTVIDALLPPQKLLCTQWFHADCLATWYNVPVFSPRHWQIIGHYMEETAKYGKNMILTPVFTPPLDTQVGGERPTVQLVDVTVTDDGYIFGFDKLGRWIDLARASGITHFEISHFFTQWGAKHAPKVMANIGGALLRLFGWGTDAAGEEYAAFLRAFIPQLLDYLKAKGVDKNCHFHISDEPSAQQLEGYLAAKAVVADMLKGYPIMDALSDYAFYESGAVEHPIPANNHIAPFLEHNVPDLWTYYCCGQNMGVSNRFMAQYSRVNRILGTQMYKFNIVGFLQWGYNFWYNQYSIKPINPFFTTDGEFFFPSGDGYTVYPGDDGRPLLSLRELVFHDGLQDMRALQLAEQKVGREKVLALLEEGLDRPLAFDHCPGRDEYLLGLREKINRILAQ